jgi:hypothetical protein
MNTVQNSLEACAGAGVFLPWALWIFGAFLLGLLLGYLIRSMFFEPKPEPVAQNPQKEDLTRIEGIGPKIQEVLYQQGLLNYHLLANTTTTHLEYIIEEAGPAFYTHRGMAKTWPAQAKLAEHGEWEELEKWQEQLKGGV